MLLSLPLTLAPTARLGVLLSLPLTLAPTARLGVLLSLPLTLAPTARLGVLLSLPLTLAPTARLGVLFSLPLTLAPTARLGVLLSLPLTLPKWLAVKVPLRLPLTLAITLDMRMGYCPRRSASPSWASIPRIAQFDRNARIMALFGWWTSLWQRPRLNSHQLLETFHLVRIQLDSSLATSPALKVVDSHALPTQHELPAIGLAEPIVEAGDGYSEAPSSFFRG